MQRRTLTLVAGGVLPSLQPEQRLYCSQEIKLLTSATGGLQRILLLPSNNSNASDCCTITTWVAIMVGVSPKTAEM
jgi:hypothetical protein